MSSQHLALWNVLWISNNVSLSWSWHVGGLLAACSKREAKLPLLPLIHMQHHIQHTSTYEFQQVYILLL
jgi:hypothetical protein